jgi:hypothetical protein
MRYLIAIAISTLIFTTAVAQDAPDPRLWAEDFMQTLVDDGAKAAHKKLLRSYLGELRPHAIAGILENMEAAEELHGNALGYEFIAQRELGESLTILGYYAKRESSPVLWKFVLYSPHPRKWKLVNFTIEDDLVALQVLN